MWFSFEYFGSQYINFVMEALSDLDVTLKDE